MKYFLMIALCLTATSIAQTYRERDGLVVMEMENTGSPLGQWQKQSDLSGYSGSGYLQFLGNTFETGPAGSPLEFNFKINRAGLYYLHLHGAKETHEGRTDVANDCYVRVEGDYTAGPGPYDGHGDNGSLTLLKNDTKYFGGATNAWKWENGEDSSGGAGNLDPGGHQDKRVAVYDFKAGESYKLVVSGRSKFFRINRMMFRHATVLESEAEDIDLAESAIVSEGESFLYDAREDFLEIDGGDIPYYRDNGNGVLAIAANLPENRVGFARASRSFGGPAGTYDVIITTMTEEDGESTYRLLVNGVQVATYTNPVVFDPPDSPLDLQPNIHTWTEITIPVGATIAVESNAVTNGELAEGEGTAWARGRWSQIEFVNISHAGVVKPPAGRLAIVSDGNSPDPDDIGAKAVMFGILGGASLNDRLVHVSHSCDLDPFSNPGNQTIDAINELRRQNKLHQLSGEGISFFGPFPNLGDYYNCRSEQAAAVNDLRDAINASSAGDPLWIVEGGEPDMIGYALQAATASKRQYVHIISHHPANDNSGDFFTWQEILDFGITEHQIGDQNVGLQVLIRSGDWDWAENHPRPEIAWIWDQLKYAEQDGVVGFQANKFDCSDAGMVYWWLTGATNGGDRNSTPLEMKSLLLNEVETAFQLMIGEGADASVKEDLVVVEQAQATTLLGAGGVNPWVDRATVYVFRLPDLGEVEDPFESTAFTFDYSSKQGDLKNNDLYGLGRRPTGDVLGSDYYGQTLTEDPSDATLLQRNILTDATSTGQLTTSVEGRTALRDYLNAQYESGVGIGEFVFLRLNTSAPKSGIHRATLTMSEGGSGTPVDTRPRIRYTTTPDVENLGPAAHWKLDEGAGVVAGDSSGNGFAGTLLNGASWSSDENRLSYVSFDGADDRISTLFSHALAAGDDFTWAWWAKPASGTYFGSIMVGNRYPQGVPGETFEFIKFTPAGAQFSNTDEVPQIEKYAYQDPVPDLWHHYAMVKTGTSYQWYVDGVASGDPETINYDEDSGIPFLIGGDDDGSGTKVNEHFEGGIDDVVLYKRALTQAEILGVKNGVYFPRSTTRIEDWRELHFGATGNSGIAADSFDANRDGESNLLEFATGQDPLAESRVETPVEVLEGGVEFRYPRSKVALADGFSFLVEWSDTLPAVSWSQLDVSESIESEDEIVENVVALIPRGSSGRKFVRLRVRG